MPLDLDALPTQTAAPEDSLTQEQLRARLYPDDVASHQDTDPVEPVEQAEQVQSQPEADPYDGKVVLFKVGGTEYLVDEDPDAAVLLRFMWTSRSGDELGALRDMLLALLGEDQFETLMNTDGLKKRHLKALVNAAIQHLAGDDEAAPKDQTARTKSGRGGRG